MIQPAHFQELENLLNEIHTFSQCNRPGSADSPNKDEWIQWLSVYATRIEKDASEWKKLAKDGEDWLSVRHESMRQSNPRFILRQWVLEEVIAKVEQDHVSGRRILAKVLEVGATSTTRVPTNSINIRWSRNPSKAGAARA